MTDEREIEGKFWKALDSDRTVMLGLADSHETQPMTAQAPEGEDGGPIYFFTAKDNDLVRTMGASHPAAFHFSVKGHGLFATVEGELALDNDRAAIDRLWNPFVAAWFEGGKDDPSLQLLRFEPRRGQVWLSEHSLVAGVRIVLGRDPKKDYADKVAKLDLGEGAGAVN